MTFDRKEPRFPVSLEAYIEDGRRRYVSVTREISLRGLFFFASGAPSVGTELAIEVHRNDDEAIRLRGRVRNSIQDVGAGVELFGEYAELERYRTMVQKIVGSEHAWQAISEFVRSGRPDSTPRELLEHKELIPVGETCEAIRILFQHYPPASPLRVFTAELLGSGMMNIDRLIGVSPLAIDLKLHPGDRMRRLYVGVLSDGGGYVAIVPPKHPPEMFRLYSLSGSELIAVSAGGVATFPYFSDRDLARIARDTVVRVPAPPPPERLPPGVGTSLAPRVPGSPTGELPIFPREELPKSPLGDWARFEGSMKRTLELLVDYLDAEVRIYRIGSQQREVRLFRDLPIRVRHGGEGSGRTGVLVYDGNKICVLFGLDTGSMEIRPLTEQDQVIVHPRKDA